MDASRVIGKEGTKEPFKWDWALIYETLEYSFYENIHRGNAEYDNSATQTSGGHVSFGKGTKSGSFEGENRLQLAMNTKWIRRISGFYRCSSDGRGYFACLPWDLANLTYCECACSLYHLLTIDPLGQSFLKQDRRGMLFNEIASELKLVIDSVDKEPPRSRFGGSTFTRGFGAARQAISNPLVFRLHSMKPAGSGILQHPWKIG